jgi:eukaryotic-like serine/threonine-protein kinase
MQPKPSEQKSQGDNAAQERAKAMIGQVISDRYRIRELIAMGGMGAVYRGDHLLLKKRIAIKLLHPETENLPELVKRFEREAIAGAHIQHPNVATATDFGKLPDGSYFLILEYVKGITLHEVLEKGPLTPRRAARFAKQIASALHAIHTKGIYHRDVKPRNIMVVDGTPETLKIIDLGLAKLKLGDFADEQERHPKDSMSDEDDATALTVAGTIFGTLAYLAPEAAEGMDAVDGRSDLYALGLIMYEMLSGKRPFVAINPVELFMQHRIAPVPSMASRSPGLIVPPVLEAIPRKLLEKKPESRFQTGEEVCAAIDEALATLGAEEGDEVVNSERPSGAGPSDSNPTPPTTMQKSASLAAVGAASQKTPLPTPTPAPVSKPSQPTATPAAAAKPPPPSQRTLPSAPKPVVKAAPPAEAPSTITTPAAVREEPAAEPEAAPTVKTRSKFQSNLVTVVAGIVLGLVATFGIKYYQANMAKSGSVKPAPTPTQQATPAVTNKPAPVATTATKAPETIPAASVAPSAATPEPAASAATPEPAASAATPPPPATTLSESEIAGLKAKYQVAWRNRNWRGAAKEAIALIKGAPSVFDDADLAQRTEKLAIALSKENADIELLEALGNHLGSKGLDILYALVEGQGRAPVALNAMKLLEDPNRVAKGTPAMQIALALRTSSCAEKLKLLDRAMKEGDMRTRLVLETLGRDCFPQSAEMEKAIFDLRVKYPRRFNYQ